MLKTVEIAAPPHDWLQRVSAACLEVLHGQRSSIHLKHVVSAKVAAALNFKASLHRNRRYSPFTIVRIHQSEVREGIYEVAVTFMSDNRAYPIAMRVERSMTSWLVTAFEVGPH